MPLPRTASSEPARTSRSSVPRVAAGSHSRGPGERDYERDRRPNRAHPEAASGQRSACQNARPAAGEERPPGNRGGPADHERPEQRHRGGEAKRRQGGERDRLRAERNHQREAAGERRQAKHRAQDPQPALGERRSQERLSRAYPERAVGGDERRQHRDHRADRDGDRVGDPVRRDREAVRRQPHRDQGVGERAEQRAGRQASRGTGEQSDRCRHPQQPPPDLTGRGADRAQERDLAPAALDGERHRARNHKHRDREHDAAAGCQHGDERDQVERARVAHVRGLGVAAVEHLRAAACGRGDA
jgi:hypothetical protein